MERNALEELNKPLEQKLQERNLKYRCDVHKDFGKLDDLVEWCKKEVIGDWGWHIARYPNSEQPGHYIFFFEHHSEYFAFALKFG